MVKQAISSTKNSQELAPLKPLFSIMKDEQLYQLIESSSEMLFIPESKSAICRFEDVICPKSTWINIQNVHANHINNPDYQSHYSLKTLDLNLEIEISFIVSQAPINFKKPSLEEAMLPYLYWEAILKSDVVIDLTAFSEVKKTSDDFAEVTPYYPTGSR